MLISILNLYLEFEEIKIYIYIYYFFHLIQHLNPLILYIYSLSSSFNCLNLKLLPLNSPSKVPQFLITIPLIIFMFFSFVPIPLTINPPLLLIEQVPSILLLIYLKVIPKSGHNIIGGVSCTGMPLNANYSSSSSSIFTPHNLKILLPVSYISLSADA